MLLRHAYLLHTTETKLPSTMEVRKVCMFCDRNENNELLYGKILKLGDDIVTHYFCLLLSSNVGQNGRDSEGILGFLREDILKEYKRGKRVICYYCKRTGATLCCSSSRCKKVFHLPCARQNGSLHQFFGEFKSFCATHRPVQNINREVLMEVKGKTAECTICRDNVLPESCSSTLWAPCCRNNAWFHRDCIQNLALNEGYYFKCPLCNNKTVFQKAMLHFGIYVPQQDASWEQVPNAYQELLHRHNSCDAKPCICPKGRSHAIDGTRWELVLCGSCGSQGMHVGCGNLKWSNPEWECGDCVTISAQEQDNAEDAKPDQFPAKRKYRYFKGGGGKRRTKQCKRRVVGSSSDPLPSSSQSPAIPKVEPTVVTGSPVCPSKEIEVIVISDDEDDDIEILDDDGDEDDDDDEDDDVDDDDDVKPSDLSSNPSTDRTLYCDGKAIPVFQITSISAPDNGQNIPVVGDLNVKFQTVAHPAASNREAYHPPGTLVPGSSLDGDISSKSIYSSVDGSSSSSKSLHTSVDVGCSSSKSLHSSVDGSGSSKSLHPTPACNHADQPSGPRTATGFLLKSYLTGENAQGGRASCVQVPAVAQQTDNQTARTQAQNHNTSNVQHSSAETSPHNTAVLPSSGFTNKPCGERCEREQNIAPSQQESGSLYSRLIMWLQESFGRAASSKTSQVFSNIMQPCCPAWESLHEKESLFFKHHFYSRCSRFHDFLHFLLTDCRILP